jgi:hypothetical protein
MNEEEFFNRIINKIAKDYGYDVASTLELMFFKKEKQLEAYENMRKEAIEYIHDKLDRFDCDGNLSISMQITYCEEDLLNILNKVGEDNE